MICSFWEDHENMQAKSENSVKPLSIPSRQQTIWEIPANFSNTELPLLEWCVYFIGEELCMLPVF